MKECSKSINRRLHDSRFVRRYFVGDGIDIGGGPDPLGLYQEFFPLMRSVRTWDMDDGDAQYLKGVPDGCYDFVFSSHCLEHLRDPATGLGNWFRVLKPNGYLILTVPDEDLYEQGVFPSTFNRDHKWTFTIHKPASWSDRSLNIVDLLTGLGEAAAIEKIELLNINYRYSLPRYDQTLTPVSECGIEAIVRKRDAEEVQRLGRRRFGKQPERELRIHLNQYRNDFALLKQGNRANPPFTDDGDL